MTSNVVPEGDAIKKAIRWVSDNLEEDPGANIPELVNEAINRFDLSPKDAEFLLRFYKNRACACRS